MIPIQPSLGSMMLSNGAPYRERYSIVGYPLPAGCDGWVLVTDRAGGEYGTFYGELSDGAMLFYEEAGVMDVIPSGSNFEMFIDHPIDGIHKVRYGRVIRRQVQYPLDPVNDETYAAIQFEDTLQRNQVGPRWVPKYGRVAMHDPGEAEIDYAMAVRNSVELFGISLTLWEDAAVLWYAPLRSDTMELTVGLCDGGGGTTTIVLCSNYAMTNFMGVRFYDSTGDGVGVDKLEIVTGTKWNALTQQGSSLTHSVATGGGIYTIRYSYPLNTLTVFLGDDLTTPLKTWEDVDNIVPHGAGRRYVGAIWNGSFADPGPMMYYWKAMDAI